VAASTEIDRQLDSIEHLIDSSERIIRTARWPLASLPVDPRLPMR
jgi:hypothetical protein